MVKIFTIYELEKLTEDFKYMLQFGGSENQEILLLDELENSVCKSENLRREQVAVDVLKKQIFTWDELRQNQELIRRKLIDDEIFDRDDYMFKISRLGNLKSIHYGLKPSNIQNVLLDTFIEYRTNHCKFLICVDKEEQIKSTTWNLHKNEPCVFYIEFTQPLAKVGKMTSQLQHNSTSSNNPTKHKETVPILYPKFQHKRKEIAQYVSFVVILTIIFGSLFFDMWIEPSLMKVQRGQIWVSSLRLFGFMAFVWAVAIMILVGVPFVRVQSVVFIFWAILMHLKSHNSITTMCVPILGMVVFGVFARGKF